MSEGISASKFYMWRAVVAMAHADGVVTAHELDFLQKALKDILVSNGQMEILKKDIKMPQDIHVMFSQISDAQDRREFFKLARVLSWSDGDFDAQERKIIKSLEEISQNQEDQALLRESREALLEVDMDNFRWDDVKDKGGLFGLLGRFVSAA